MDEVDISRPEPRALPVDLPTLRLIAENVPAGSIYVFDRELRFALVAGAGPTPAVEGKTVSEAFDADLAGRLEPPFRAALAGEKSTFELQYEDDDYVVTVAPLRDGDGVIGGLMQAQQVTAQRQLEHRLRQSQKLEAVGRLAGGIAHDFNNLLTVIGGYTTLALKKTPDDDLRRTLDNIAGATERATALTRQLLAFSRQQLLLPSLVDVSEVIEQILPLLSRLIESRIELRSSMNADVPPVLFDRSQLEQILVNLVLNARDAIPNSGSILIEVSQTTLDEDYVIAHPDASVGQHIVLSVTDTGEGMDAATRARIFEPFFTTKGELGNGLGLAVVHGIVNQSGGTIWVYSELGRGTTFKIYLPAEAEAHGDTAELVLNEGGEAHRAPPGTIVLVVDDHQAVRSLAVAVLESAGYTVLDAASTDEAAVILADSAVDVIVSDVVLPGGTATAPIYPQDARGREPGVIYMSGYTADALRGDVLGANARFLEKPFSPAALLRCTAEVIAD